MNKKEAKALQKKLQDNDLNSTYLIEEKEGKFTVVKANLPFSKTKEKTIDALAVDNTKAPPLQYKESWWGSI